MNVNKNSAIQHNGKMRMRSETEREDGPESGWGGGSVEMETRSDRLLSNRKRQRKSVHRMPVILMSQKKNRVDWYILNLIKVGS